MQRPMRILRRLTEDVASLQGHRNAFWALDPDSGRFSRVDGSPKGPLGALCAFCFLLGLALGLWTAFPQAALALLLLLAVGVTGLAWYWLCMHVRRREGLKGDESVMFWDL